MNTDLLDMFNATLGGPLIRRLGSHLGETEDATRAAVRSAGPALLAGLMQRLAASGGATDIFRTATSDAADPFLAGKLAGLLSNRGALESLLGSGESLSGLVFGPRTAAVSNAVADTSGVQPASALTLLSLGASLLFGMLRKLVANNDLDATALASLLARQRGSLERHGLDDRIVGALGIGSLGAWLRSLSGAAAAASPERNMRDNPWLPWAIAAGIAVFGVLFFVNRTAEHQDAPQGAVQIAEVPGNAARLRVATADSAQVYFDSSDASIDTADRRRIADMASAARDSERPVTITGYTDHGDEDRNLTLARDRAQAVRQALVSEGVREDRIVMDPPRSATGSDTDDEARRVDIDMR